MLELLENVPIKQEPQDTQNDDGTEHEMPEIQIKSESIDIEDLDDNRTVVKTGERGIDEQTLALSKNVSNDKLDFNFNKATAKDVDITSEIINTAKSIGTSNTKREDNVSFQTCDDSNRVNFFAVKEENLDIKSFNDYKGNINTPVLLYRSEVSTFECGLCNFLTTISTKIMEHLHQKHSFKALHCFCCIYSTNTKVKMEAHIEHHLNNANVLETPKIPKFQCLNCDHKAETKPLLKLHYLSIHIKKLMFCITCKIGFHFIVELEAHINNVHECDFYKEPNLVLGNFKNYYQTDTNKDAVNIFEYLSVFKCLHCNFFTQYRGNFINHVKIHKYETTETESKVLHSLPNMQVFNTAETKPNIENMYSCTYCPFTALLWKRLKEHIIKVHSDKQKFFRCDICGKYFSTHRIRNKHIKYLHTEGKTLYCMHCKFSTNRARSLENHVQYHSGQLSQLCYICGFQSVHKRYMDLHIQDHLGEAKQYSCHLCNYKTPRKPKLSDHLNSHSTERPYVCSVCDHRSKSARDLKKHMNTHVATKPFACSLCDYRCVEKYFLKKHMKIHSTNRQLLDCLKCDKKFASAQSLKQHALMHDGIKPHVCTYCPFSTSRVVSLQIHQKRHLELSRMYCFECNYNSTHRANFIEHVNRTCAKARHGKENLRHCFYCGYKSSHRSNFTKHVNEGCSKRKMLLKTKSKNDKKRRTSKKKVFRTSKKKTI